MAGGDTYTGDPGGQRYGGLVANPITKNLTLGSKGGRPTETVNLTQKIGSTETSLYTSATTAAKGALLAPKDVVISNTGGAPAGVVMKLNHWSADSTNETNPIYIQFLIASGETVNFPMSRIIAADNVATLMDGTALAQAAPDSNMYIDSTADADNTTATDNVIGDIDDTTVYLEPYTDATNCTANLFRVGDLIRIRAEIMEVTAIGDKSDLENNTLTVIRGAHGSTAVDVAADDDPVSLAFFNAYHPFTAATGGYDKVQTDNDGKFRSTNFFGYGRGLTYKTTGILPGSVAFKFYNSGFQELGMSGVTPGTNTGLAASTAYNFNITVDGGSVFVDFSFTTDASNLNFGGRNGVLSKIQDALDTQYYTAGNLFTKKVSVGIVNGDIRFTSGTRLSASAILLAAPGSGTTPFGVGRIPSIGVVEDAVAARLPDNTISTVSSGQTVSNVDVFMYDDGNGKLVGNGNGTINYDTGAVNFTSYPNAEFVVSARYGNGLSGSVSEAQSNTIEDIAARSLNDNIETTVSLSVTGYDLNK